MPRRIRKALPLLFAGCLSLLAAQPPAKIVACGSCHAEQAKTQPDTDMAHAMERPASNGALNSHPKLEFQFGIYRYSIEQHGGSATYSVTDGSNTLNLPILWPFGRNSQTFVLEYRGHLYESLVSFYPAAHGLDLTVGDPSLRPQSLEEAMGRLLSAGEAKSCFGCHSTGSIDARQLNTAHTVPGVTCARCHLNAEAHMQSISNGKLDAVPPRLKRFSPEETSTFCGQCHRTWQTVVRNRWLGIMNVRFQPYRLANSKCFDGVDQRMSCVACHDPHRQVETDSKAYDLKCLACHSTSAKPSAGMLAAYKTEMPVRMKVCPVAKENCVSCHMPKVDLPGAHRAFTDHYIRVVQPNAAYPD